MDNIVAYDEQLYDQFNNTNNAIDFGNLDYEELDEGEDMDDSEEQPGSSTQKKNELQKIKVLLTDYCFDRISFYYNSKRYTNLGVGEYNV